MQYRNIPFYKHWWFVCLFLMVVYGSTKAQSPQWQRVDEGLPLSISALGAGGTMVFAAVPGYGVYTSANGNEWQRSLVNGNVKVEQLLVTSFGAILTGFEEDYTQSALYIYENNTWTRSISFRNQALTLFEAAESNGTLFMSTENGFILSKDRAKSWNAVQLPSGAMLRSLVTTASGMAILADNGRTYYRSTDGGSSWSPVTLNTGSASSTTFSIQSKTSDALWLVSDAGVVYRSINDGVSWVSVSTGLPTGQPITNIAASGNTTLLTTQKGEVYRLSSDVWVLTAKGLPGNTAIYPLRLVAGNNGWFLAPSASAATLYRLPIDSELWTENRSGLPSNMDISQGISALRVMYLVAASGELFISRDKGASWQKSMNGITADDRITSVDVTSAAAVVGTMRGAMYRSTDDGANWNAVQGGAALTLGKVQSIIHTGSIFMASVGASVYASSDDGRTWSKVLSDVGEITSGVSVGGSAFFATTDKGIMRSANNGSTWGQYNTGLSAVQGDYGIKSLAAAGSVVLISVEHPSLEFRSTYKSDISTANWQQVNNFLINASATSVQGIDTVTLAGTSTNGIFRVYNSASDWQAFGFNAPVQTLWTDGGYVYAGTSSGLYRANVTATPTSVRSKSIISEARCQPNPVYDIATITYPLAASGNIKLQVSDVLGRIVTVVEEGYRLAGTHTATLNLGSVPHGTYYVTAFSGSIPMAVIPLTVIR